MDVVIENFDANAHQVDMLTPRIVCGPTISVPPPLPPTMLFPFRLDEGTATYGGFSLVPPPPKQALGNWLRVHFASHFAH